MERKLLSADRSFVKILVFFVVLISAFLRAASEMTWYMNLGVLTSFAFLFWLIQTISDPPTVTFDEDFLYVTKKKGTRKIGLHKISKSRESFRNRFRWVIRWDNKRGNPVYLKFDLSSNSETVNEFHALIEQAKHRHKAEENSADR